MGGDRKVSYAPAPSVTKEGLSIHALIILEMEVFTFNREEVWNSIMTYHTIFGKNTRDAMIKYHLALETQPKGVNWLKPFDIFRFGETPLKNIELVILAWVVTKIMGTSFSLNSTVIVRG